MLICLPVLSYDVQNASILYTSVLSLGKLF